MHFASENKACIAHQSVTSCSSLRKSSASKSARSRHQTTIGERCTLKLRRVEKDNSNFFREAKFSSPPSIRFGLIAQRALRRLRRRPVYRTVCRSPNLLFSMRLNSKSDGLLGLFDFDFCSSGFNLLLDLFRFFFGDSFFDRLGSAFDQGFRFGES